jgi:hypothetical protein
MPKLESMIENSEQQIESAVTSSIATIPIDHVQKFQIAWTKLNNGVSAALQKRVSGATPSAGGKRKRPTRRRRPSKK